MQKHPLMTWVLIQDLIFGKGQKVHQWGCNLQDRYYHDNAFQLLNSTHKKILRKGILLMLSPYHLIYFTCFYLCFPLLFFTQNQRLSSRANFSISNNRTYTLFYFYATNQQQGLSIDSTPLTNWYLPIVDARNHVSYTCLMVFCHADMKTNLE